MDLFRRQEKEFDTCMRAIEDKTESIVTLDSETSVWKGGEIKRGICVLM